MADSSLIVPTLVPSGSLHFAAVRRDAVAKDIIDALSGLEELRSEVLGDLKDSGWSVQRLRKERNGRLWEEAELEALGDGILPDSTPISPILNSSSKPASPQVQRHFSAFPLTSHLHTPELRLVSRHPLLCITLQLLRIPEIHDGFQWKRFLAYSTTVDDVIQGVCEELGLTKHIPGPAGGPVEYVMEQVWQPAKGNEGQLYAFSPHFVPLKH